MNVLIVGKTHMQAHACIGGLVLDNNRSVRLLQADGWNHPANTDFAVGQIWDIDFQDARSVVPPHVEDVLIQRRRFVRDQANLQAFLLERVPVWRGPIDQIYDGHIRFTDKGSGYVSQADGVPAVSTGYWIADQRLHLETYSGKARYRYIEKIRLAGFDQEFIRIRYISYVGCAEPVVDIPAGALIRLSLARWWRPDDKPEMEERCYLQLSGWFL